MDSPSQVDLYALLPYHEEEVQLAHIISCENGLSVEQSECEPKLQPSSARLLRPSFAFNPSFRFLPHSASPRERYVVGSNTAPLFPESKALRLAHVHLKKTFQTAMPA